jgi:hypothetical protein
MKILKLLHRELKKYDSNFRNFVYGEIAKSRLQERARRAAAAEARFAKDKSNQELARKLVAQKKAQKGKSALEQASMENRGWRAADEMATMRSYN